MTYTLATNYIILDHIGHTKYHVGNLMISRKSKEKLKASKGA